MADEDELEELREQKRKEIENGLDEESQVEQQREQIKNLAAKHLTKEARSRLGNIRAAKPELASAVETQIARLGRMGQVDKIGDEKLKQILKEVQNSGKDTDIKFRR